MLPVRYLNQTQPEKSEFFIYKQGTASIQTPTGNIIGALSRISYPDNNRLSISRISL